MAFATLLAVVPLVTLVLSVAGLIPQLEPLLGRLDDLMRQTILPSSAAGTIAGNIGKFSHKAQQLTVAGLALLTATAFFLMNTIERAFNHLWQVEPRPIWARVRLYAFVMTIWPFLLAAVAAAISYAVTGALGWFNEAEWVSRLAVKGVSLLLIGGFVAFLYYAVPNARVPAAAALLGGAFVTAGFAALQKLFELYLVRSVVLKSVYGTFAIFPLFLVWLQLCWAVVLFGGLLAASTFRRG